MPRLPKNYSKNVIYKLVCNDLNIKECYVGHTTDFTQRKANHKSDCNNGKGNHHNYKIYKTIRENGGWENYSMIEIEKYPCRDENEATAKEREWFEILNSGLNTIYPQRSRQEYRDDNRIEILQKKLEYYNTNKEEIAIQRKQTFICECGGIITVRNKSRHLKSKFHKQYMNRDTVVQVVQSVVVQVVQSVVVQVVPPIIDTQLNRGICYIPLEQFENIKEQEEMNEDHFYMSNHNDYMHSHAI
jgi:hypothetical protein